MFTRLIYISLFATITIACSLDEPATVVAKFQTIGSGCNAPCTVTFTEVSENKSMYRWQYKWAIKDGPTFSTEKNSTYSFAVPGKYRIVLMLNNNKYGSSSFEDTVTIRETPMPKAAFDFSTGECHAPCEVTFVNQSTNATGFQWHFGDGQTSKEQSPKHLYLKPGAFPAKLVASLGAVKDSISRMVNVSAVLAPEADFDIVVKDSTRADSAIYSFVNKSRNATTYFWEFGDKTQTVTKSPTHAYPRTSNDVQYNVTLTALSAASMNKKIKTLSVKKK